MSLTIISQKQLNLLHSQQEKQQRLNTMNKQTQNSRTPFIYKAHTATVKGVSEKRQKNSNSSVKSSNGPYSQYNHKYRECRSHIFQLKPYHHNTRGSEAVSLKLGHINETHKPYPVVLKDYLSYGLAPLFGLTVDDHIRSKSVSKMKEQLQMQVARVKMGQDQKELLLSPKPKHNSCQVCRREYADYVIHISSPQHRRAVQESLGYQFIQQTIDQFRLAIQDQNNEDDLSILFNLAVTLEEVIPNVRDHFKSFLIELNTKRSTKF